MTTYPSEIYVRSTDANNTIVKAKYLTDDSGNYIFNPDSEKFNIFVKDANGQYVSYLTAAQQAHTATPSKRADSIDIKQSTLSTMFLIVIFTSFFLSGCLPSFWIDDNDFQNNLPDNSIQAYWDYWASDIPEVRSRKLHTAYRDDFLKMFPLGDQIIPAKGYLMGIGAKCSIHTVDKEKILNTCVYRRKIKTYRGYLGGNFGAEKTLMHEGWINVIYKIQSRQNVLTDITVETTDEPIYTYTYTESPKEKQERIKQIENCRPPECIRAF